MTTRYPYENHYPVLREFILGALKDEPQDARLTDGQLSAMARAKGIYATPSLISKARARYDIPDKWQRNVLYFKPDKAAPETKKNKRNKD